MKEITMSRTIKFPKAGGQEAGLESGALKPVIERTFKFDDMVEAHHYLERATTSSERWL
jgi:Zinc-binding dehydrogenase